METACYLAGLGSSVSVVVRSQILRSFDQQVVRQLEDQLQNEENLEILIGSKVTKIVKSDDGRLEVSIFVEGQENVVSDVDCVVLAVGRYFNTDSSGLNTVEEVRINSSR